MDKGKGKGGGKGKGSGKGKGKGGPPAQVFEKPTVTNHKDHENERVLPRKLTAIGVSGDVGASFTVYEKNWVHIWLMKHVQNPLSYLIEFIVQMCTECDAENYARRQRCWRCRASKPEGGGGLVTDEALQKDMAGEVSAWKETVDPESGHIYYYNKETHETR